MRVIDYRLRTVCDFVKRQLMDRQAKQGLIRAGGISTYSGP
ncbi:hypothetical protein [Natronococcus pandeyae]|nr:hypothetical protein [Natronococcus pandeyae]